MKKIFLIIVCILSSCLFQACEEEEVYSSTSGSRQRCIAITQKGTRCKRLAEEGSLYCWQHKYKH